MTTTNVEAAPRAVFAGSYLLAGMAAVALAAGIASVYAIPEFSYVQNRLSHNDSGTLVVVAVVTYAVLAVVFGGLCLVLAALDKRGSSVGRTLTWILGGLAVCFNVISLFSGLYDSVSWYQNTIQLSAWALIPLAAASVALLAQPSSSAYFRAVRAARRPSGPPPGYRPPNHLTPPPGYQPPGTTHPK